MSRTSRAAALALLIAFAAVSVSFPARADEGMWTLDHLPLAQLRERHGFVPPAGWTDHVRLSCVRFNSGGSGSFVSPEGLVVTNHHIAMEELQKLATPENDVVTHGFFARTRADEARCPGLELNQLVAMEDVTARVQAAARGASEAERNARRRAAVARIEQESAKRTGLRSDVVTLYAGGEYWLYRYRKFTDVRLVMAPEAQAANFGGDPDNFSWPRFGWDVAFFRVYENGRPVDSRGFHFPLRAEGPADSELVFVAGHPGRTSRLETADQVRFHRDVELPLKVARARGLLRELYAYAATGPEANRRATNLVLELENSAKAYEGYLEGLRDPAWMEQVAARDAGFRARVEGTPRLDSLAHGAWDRLAAVAREEGPRFAQEVYTDARAYRGCELASYAATIVDWADQLAQPNEARDEEYRESALESLREELLAPLPIHADLQERMLALTLRQALDALGPDDPWVRAAVQGRDPAAVAHELVAGTQLADPEVRRRLLAGGAAAVEASPDPMIAWARRIAPAYRAVHRWHRDAVESVQRAEGERLARARFAAYGRDTYPDATFTLRLSIGCVAGYPQLTTLMPPRTTFGGLFDRSDAFGGKAPFDLPPAFAATRAALDPRTPFDYVATTDIIGGNSGSPVIDRDARFVGIVFDGNIQGLVLDFAFSEAQARAIAVHPAAILAALRTVYGMDALADEFEGRSIAPGR